MLDDNSPLSTYHLRPFELLEIQKDHATSISKENFCKLYSEAVTDPYSFFVIDKQTRLIPLMYRKCFDELCQLIFEQRAGAVEKEPGYSVWLQ